MRFAETALALLVPDRDVRQGMLGDWAEEFHATSARDGARAARRALRREVARSLPHLLRAALFPRVACRIASTMAGATAGWMSAVAIAGITALLSARFGGDWNPRQPLALLMQGFIALAGALIGGYVAARVGRRSPLASAFWFAVLVIAGDLVMAGLVRGLWPSWFIAGLNLMTLPAVLAGAALRVRRFPDAPTSIGIL